MTLHYGDNTELQNETVFGGEEDVSIVLIQFWNAESKYLRIFFCRGFIS